MTFAVFTIGTVALGVAFVALLRSSATHSPAFYGELVLIELAAIAVALATEYRVRGRPRSRGGVRSERGQVERGGEIGEEIVEIL